MINYSDLYKSPAETFTGYEYGNERDLLELERLSEMHKLLLRESYSFDDIPDEVDFSWHVLENQMRQGSCWTAGNKITMADGSRKNIEDVTIGEYVLSHTGKSRRVNQTFTRNYTGKLYTIELEGFHEPVTVTDNHKYLLKSQDKSREKVDDMFVKIRADELKEGDVLYLSTKSSSETRTTIDLADYIDNPYNLTMEYIQAGKRSKKIKRYVNLDHKLGWLLGFYAAEGYTSTTKNGGKRVYFATNSSEKDLHAKVHKLMAEIFGLELAVKKDPRPNNFYQYTGSKTLGIILENLCGKYSNNKKVPVEILSSNDSCKMAYIRGWLDGDGSAVFAKKGDFFKNGKKRTRDAIKSVGYTISKELGYGLFSLSLSIGLDPVLSHQKERSGNRKAQSIIRFGKIDTLNLFSDIAPKWAHHVDGVNHKGIVATMLQKKIRNKVTESLVSCKIKRITTRDVIDYPVYNLEADIEHTVVVNGIAGPQCQGHSLTSCMEGCYWIDSGGDTVQLSRNAGYRFSQMEDGINGDRGSTLSGGVAAARKGICKEEYFPYTETYSRRIPKAAFDNRSEFKLVTAVPLQKDNPAAQLCQWIGKGRGFCAIAMKWTSEMDSQSKITKYSGRGAGGGHAIGFLGYSLPNKTVKLVNSWGYHWGKNGVKDVTFDAFNKIMRYGWNHGYLYSDIDDVDVKRDIPDYSIIGEVV